MNASTTSLAQQGGVWRLWACAQETGTDWLVDSGDKDEMISRMAAEAERGRDVWVIAPDGAKHLPAAA